jgi:hypothetical protein
MSKLAKVGFQLLHFDKKKNKKTSIIIKTKLFVIEKVVGRKS